RHANTRARTIIDRYAEDASCPSLAYREDLVVCARAPEAVATHGPTELQIELDCDLSTTWGREGALRTFRTLEVDEDSAFNLIIDPDSSATLTSCEPGCAFGSPIVLGPVEPTRDGEAGVQPIHLAAGRYALRIRRSEPGDATIEFRPR
ncbi:MAG: hypothetical protein AAF721_30765, partial [Myxococcota bacterium]